MTNNMIILMERVRLMKDGIIGTTGRTFEIEDSEGNKQIINEPEPIFTYASWKSMGYQVKKGEKHIAEIMIWKMGKGQACGTCRRFRGESTAPADVPKDRLLL